MLDHLDNRNRDPKPFVWTAGADLILAKVERICKRTYRSKHTSEPDGFHSCQSVTGEHEDREHLRGGCGGGDRSSGCYAGPGGGAEDRALDRTDGTAAARNIAAEFTGGVKVDGMTLPSTGIADAGDTAFYMSADPFLPPRNKVIVKRGRWARYLKLTFERYYLARIRHDLPSMNFGW